MKLEILADPLPEKCLHLLDAIEGVLKELCGLKPFPVGSVLNVGSSMVLRRTIEGCDIAGFGSFFPRDFTLRAFEADI
jgi:hypothetical protein